MAKRGRRKDGRNVRGPEGVSDQTVAQLKLDFTPEQAMACLFEAGDLSARIEALDGVALETRREQRKLKAALAEILKQASAKKLTKEVAVYQRVDEATKTVLTLRKDNDEEVSSRPWTSEEIKSGVVLAPGQAKAALAAIAAEAGEQPMEGSGNGHAPAGDFTFNEDDPAPAGSPHPADVAQVAASVGHEAGA